MSIRIYFLLAVGGVALNLSPWEIGILLAGYAICEAMDEFLRKKKMRKRLVGAVDYEFDGWETEQDDPTMESKGNLSRFKLAEENQTLFARMTALMRSVIFAATE